MNIGKRRVHAVLLIAIVAAPIAFWCWPRSTVENQDVGSIEPTLDEKYRELVIGTWEDDYKGHRTLTIRADGTATMVVEPDGMNALFATQLTFEERWSIEEGQLRQQAIGGVPEGRVRLILKTMGDESVQKILELTTDRLLLLDQDGETKYDWRRIE